MSDAAGCLRCYAGTLLKSHITTVRRCDECGTDTFSFTMDRGPSWTVRVPGDVVRATLSGDVSAIVPFFVGNMGVPITDARPWGSLCRSYHPDMAAWAAAFDSYDGPREDWVLDRFRAGVRLLQQEEQHRMPLPSVTFAVEVEAPEGEHSYYPTSATAHGDLLYVAPRGFIYAWKRGEQPRQVWSGDGILEPLGGGFWGRSTPTGGPLLKVGPDGALVECGEGAGEGSRPYVSLRDGHTVVHWRCEPQLSTRGYELRPGRTDVLCPDGSIRASLAGRGGELWPVNGGWLSLDEFDEQGEVVPVSFRDAALELVWRCPDRWALGGFHGMLLSHDKDTLELLGPDRSRVARRGARDGALLEDPLLRTTSPVTSGGWCGYGQGQIYCDLGGERRWSIEGSPVWVGSDRLFLAVGDHAIHLVDSVRGTLSEAIPRPEEAQRVYGVAAHGGVYLGAGVRAAFVGADGVAGPWGSLPFPAHASGTVFDEHIVYVSNENEPRSVVARQDDGRLVLDGVVEGAHLARGTGQLRHWLGTRGAGPVFVSSDGWRAVAWP